MKPKSIIAHRGFWSVPSEKNSLDAFKRALLAGFSIETDFRDHKGELVIAHNPPKDSDTLIPAVTFFKLFQASASEGAYVAMNVKADGLHSLLASTLEKAECKKSCGYVFDMSAPDTLGYISGDFPIFTRQSEHEPDPIFLDKAIGIWVDSFSNDPTQVDRAANWLEKGYKVAFVSPELHQRPYEAIWSDIRTKKLHNDANFSICTDMPSRALNYFQEEL